MLDHLQEKRDEAKEEKRVAEEKRYEKQKAMDEKLFKTTKKCISGK